MMRLAAITAAVISFLALTAVASAQYPPPEGVVVVSVSDPTPPTNTRVTITWTVDRTQTALPPGESSRQGLLTIALQDPGGGAPSCRPEIISQPGTDAGVNVLHGSVNAHSVGAAELYTGSTPGPIVIRITCPSGPTADVTVMVQSAPLSISANTDQSTGVQPGADSGSSDIGGKAMLLAGLSVLAVSVVVGGRLLARKR